MGAVSAHFFVLPKMARRCLRHNSAMKRTVRRRNVSGGNGQFLLQFTRLKV